MPIITSRDETGIKPAPSPALFYVARAGRRATVATTGPLVAIALIAFTIALTRRPDGLRVAIGDAIAGLDAS